MAFQEIRNVQIVAAAMLCAGLERSVPFIAVGWLVLVAACMFLN